MKPKERLMNMDLTGKDMDTILKALACCATLLVECKFTKQARFLYYRWRGDTRPGEDLGVSADTPWPEPGEVLTVKSQDVFVKPEPKKVSCAICNVEFLLDPFGSVNEGASVSFVLGGMQTDAYFLCRKCWLWIPEVAIRALRQIHAEPLSLCGGRGGGEMLIQSSDSWEPGGDLTCSS